MFTCYTHESVSAFVSLSKIAWLKLKHCFFSGFEEMPSYKMGSVALIAVVAELSIHKLENQR